MRNRFVATVTLAAAAAFATPAPAQTQAADAGPLTIVAQLKAKPGREKELQQALEALLEPTRHEPGNINYDMLVSNQDPGLFIFYENWRTKAEWEHHMKSPHLVAFANRQPELAADWKLYQMSREP